ncbi:hypothetical protein [Ruegeria arenilitoris]|uniref:hypothetical protein n=1 Tax=Ruegeria arenilitoris TaxID=1173585 RepID=UPI0014810879|nr:hypothetical protein [Ruegeria arenilitoris]
MSWYGLTIPSNVTIQIGMFAATWLLIQFALQPPQLKNKVRYASERFRGLDETVKIGVWGTLTLVLIVVAVFGFTTCSEDGTCTNKFAALLNSSPNVFGDTLAGIASALAFLWLIVTVVLQGKELAAQRLELSLSRAEYEKMAGAMTDQAEVLKYERKFREFERERRILDQLLANLVRVCSLTNKSLRLDFEREKDDYSRLVDDSGNYDEDQTQIDRLEFFSNNLEGLLDDRVYQVSEAAITTLHWLSQSNRASRCVSKGRPEFFERIVDLIDQILERQEKVSKDDALRIVGLQLPQMKESLEKMLAMDLWRRAGS